MLKEKAEFVVGIHLDCTTEKAQEKVQEEAL